MVHGMLLSLQHENNNAPFEVAMKYNFFLPQCELAEGKAHSKRHFLTAEVIRPVEPQTHRNNPI